MKKKLLIILGLIFFFLISSTGCLGSHATCPDCDGLGKDSGTLFITECDTCGGDGEVGLFMNDEETEDTISILLLVVTFVVVLVLIIESITKQSKKNAQEYPFNYQQQQSYSHQYQQNYPQQINQNLYQETNHYSHDEKKPKETIYPNNQSEYNQRLQEKELKKPPKFCPECGEPSGGSKFCRECGIRLVS